MWRERTAWKMAVSAVLIGRAGSAVAALGVGLGGWLRRLRNRLRFGRLCVGSGRLVGGLGRPVRLGVGMLNRLARPRFGFLAGVVCPCLRRFLRRVVRLF